LLDAVILREKLKDEMSPKPENKAREEIETTVAMKLKRAEGLRQAILKKAFSGRLITQKE